MCPKCYLGNQAGSVRGQSFQVLFLGCLCFPFVPLQRSRRREKQIKTRVCERTGWHALKCACVCTYEPTPNVSLPTRARATEHLFFLIRTLKLSHLNVSPSIIATHHFHYNPREMNCNSLPLSSLFLSLPPSFPLCLSLSSTIMLLSSQRH